MSFKLTQSRLNSIHSKTSDHHQVSLRWKLCIDQIYYKDLVIEYKFRRPTKRTLWQMKCDQVKWYHRRDTTSNEYVAKINLIDDLRRFRFNLVNLRCLKMLGYLECYDDEINDFKFSFFDQFTKLEHLELPAIDLNKLERLCVPKLKILWIDHIDNPNHCTNERKHLMIDTPVLKILICTYGTKYLRILNPESIEYLAVDNDAGVLYENVRTLKLLQSDYVTIDGLLDRFPKLTELHFENKYIRLVNFVQTKEYLEHILWCRKASRRVDLKIYFLGDLLLDCKQLDAYDARLNRYALDLPWQSYLSIYSDDEFDLVEMFLKPNLSIQS